METSQIRFTDGAGYEQFMGVWSRLAGDVFLDWLRPESGLRWLDVGCGNGVFTEKLVERCGPKSVDGVDPSEEQISFARTRPSLSQGRFRTGDAMALPYTDDSFDAAVMPLVIFFVPDPAKGVAEMARVVRPGGIVAAYGWDMLGGGFPYAALRDEMAGLGVTAPMPPSPGASDIGAMKGYWAGAGLRDVATREITVQRTFAGFDDYWTTVLKGPSTAGTIGKMAPKDIDTLKSKMRQRLPEAADGGITYSSRANAIKGRVGPHSKSP